MPFLVYVLLFNKNTCPFFVVCYVFINKQISSCLSVTCPDWFQHFNISSRDLIILWLLWHVILSSKVLSPWLAFNVNDNVVDILTFQPIWLSNYLAFQLSNHSNFPPIPTFQPIRLSDYLSFRLSNCCPTFQLSDFLTFWLSDHSGCLTIPTVHPFQLSDFPTILTVQLSNCD